MLGASPFMTLVIFLLIAILGLQWLWQGLANKMGHENHTPRSWYIVAGIILTTPLIGYLIFLIRNDIFTYWFK